MSWCDVRIAHDDRGALADAATSTLAVLKVLSLDSAKFLREG